jgi:hypothetical protein
LFLMDSQILGDLFGVHHLFGHRPSCDEVKSVKRLLFLTEITKSYK